MTLATWHCGLGCGDVTYCPELYGSEGPIPLHHVLVHETNQDRAVNAVLTVGLMSRKGATDMAHESSVSTDTTSEVDRPLGHYDTVRALRRWGHGDLADNLVRVLTDRALDHESALVHYEALLAEVAS